VNPYLTVEGSTLKAIPTKEHNTLRSLHRISKSVYVTASQPSQVAPVVERARMNRLQRQGHPTKLWRESHSLSPRPLLVITIIAF
jgi:hypothetical protein